MPLRNANALRGEIVVADDRIYGGDLQRAEGVFFTAAAASVAYPRCQKARSNK